MPFKSICPNQRLKLGLELLQRHDIPSGSRDRGQACAIGLLRDQLRSHQAIHLEHHMRPLQHRIIFRNDLFQAPGRRNTAPFHSGQLCQTSHEVCIPVHLRRQRGTVFTWPRALKVGGHQLLEGMQSPDCENKGTQALARHRRVVYLPEEAPAESLLANFEQLCAGLGTQDAGPQGRERNMLRRTDDVQGACQTENKGKVARVMVLLPHLPAQTVIQQSTGMRLRRQSPQTVSRPCPYSN